jgi:thymidylate synthase
MKVYKDMIIEVLDHGTRKENRTSVDTLSTFNWNYELSWDWRLATSAGSAGLSRHGEPMWPYGVPLLTTKRISWKNIVVELLWFLSGDPSIDILHRHGCKFWDAWADEDGNVPSAYGNFWRHYPSGRFQHPFVGYNDQLTWIINTLRKDPMSRRCVMSAWAPENAQNSKLPPCHFAVYFNVQLNQRGEKRLCLHLTQRSCDLALGVPYNMASYGLLLLIIGRLVGIEPGIFAHTLCDLHVYTKKPNGDKAEWDHVPGLKEQLTRPARDLPRVVIDPSIRELSDIEALMKPEVTTERILEVFKLEGYDPHPAIAFKVAV